MSAYLITRDGQELGSFEASQIQEGLKTGFFQPTDWGWREGMSGWQGVSEIVGTAPVPAPATSAAPQAKAISSPTSAPVKKPTGQQPDSLNPYAAPTANVQAAATGVVPVPVIAALMGTKPWVRFISILMWIGCAGFLLIIVANLFFGMMGASALVKSGHAAGGVGVIIGMAVVYGIMALLIIYPTLKLSKYASNIARLGESRSFTDLTAALTEQRRFWKFYGILMIIYLSFAALFVILVFAGVGIGNISR